jgi:hypothetical protein
MANMNVGGGTSYKAPKPVAKFNTDTGKKVLPKPAYVAPKPAPKPAYVAPKPAYVAPKPVTQATFQAAAKSTPAASSSSGSYSGSIVDWMKANGQDSSFGNRAKLAAQYGIGGYTGSAAQNIQLLNMLRSGGGGAAPAPAAPAPVAPVAPPPPPKPTLTEDQLRDYSLRALNGDQSAIDYLNNNGFSAMTGQNLWKNYDPTKGFGSHQAQATYLNDMSEGEFAKKFDDEWYSKYNEAITGNKAMDGWEVNLYNDIVKRRNLDDFNNPYVQAAQQLEKDKQSALSAQDVALNQGMAQMDANSFQQFEQLQQNMAQRGMHDSGIGADAYMRAQMANNQNYQQAFAEGATTKSNLQTDYNKAISDAKLGKWDYDNQLAQGQAEQAIKLQEIQNDQDKWLTESTGSVFLNGQRIMMDGKPLTTIEWEKLSEEKRSNLAQEALEGQKNAWDFQLGQEQNQIGWDSNAIKRQQVAVDLQIATSKLQLDYAKLDYNYAKLDSNNMIAQDKIRIMSDNAQTAADKSKITSLGQQLNSLTSQITAYQKNGKKPPADLVTQYNRVLNDLNTMAGNF